MAAGKFLLLRIIGLNSRVYKLPLSLLEFMWLLATPLNEVIDVAAETPRCEWVFKCD